MVAALGTGAGIAEGHRRDPGPRIGLEGRPINALPDAQALAGRVIERKAADLDPSAGRLVADQDPGLGRHLEDGSRRVGEVRRAGATGANPGEQVLEG